MTLLTKANPLQALKLRALISGESKPTKPRAPKRKGKPAGVLVDPLAWSDALANTLTIQIPLRLDSDQYNANGAHWRKASTAKLQIDTTLGALRTALRAISQDRFTRERIRAMTLIRISPARLGDDNLISAFKHVRDAACAWLAKGDEDFDRRVIGRFDDDVNTPGGLQCTYEQTSSQRDKLAHGIQIRFSF